MEIKLTVKESEEYFCNALCNAGGEIEFHGIKLDWDAQEYSKAKKSLEAKGENTCIEDILMEVLRNGGELKVNDVEGEGDYNSSITLKDVHERVKNTPQGHLMDMVNEIDDATTGDVILQTVFFNEVIFG